MSEISKLAVVERGAKIADSVRIGPFSYIGPHVRIGPGCIVENNVTITGHTTLGERNHVFPMAVLGVSPEGDKESGEVVIGEGNVFREHVTLYAGGEKPTRIGTDNLVMIGCHIGAGAQIGNHGIFVNCTHVGSEAKIQDYVRTSGFIIIGAGVTVGAYTFTLGYAEIDRDAPPFAMVQGSPFRVRGVNTENLRRCGFGEDDVRALKNAVRELYNGSGETADPDVLQRLLNDSTANPHVLRLAQAVKAAKIRSDQ